MNISIQKTKIITWLLALCVNYISGQMWHARRSVHVPCTRDDTKLPHIIVEHAIHLSSGNGWAELWPKFLVDMLNHSPRPLTENDPYSYIRRRILVLSHLINCQMTIFKVCSTYSRKCCKREVFFFFFFFFLPFFPSAALVGMVVNVFKEIGDEK